MATIAGAFAVVESSPRRRGVRLEVVADQLVGGGGAVAGEGQTSSAHFSPRHWGSQIGDSSGLRRRMGCSSELIQGHTAAVTGRGCGFEAVTGAGTRGACSASGEAFGRALLALEPPAGAHRLLATQISCPPGNVCRWVRHSTAHGAAYDAAKKTSAHARRVIRPTVPLAS